MDGLESRPSQPVEPSAEKVEAITDPVERAVAAHRAMQDLTIELGRLREVRREAAYAAIEQGVATDVEIAAALGVTDSRVRQMVKETRDKLGRSGPNKQELAPRILTKDFLRAEYLEAGKSISQIAEETEFSDLTVRKYLELHDIPVRGRGPAKSRKGKPLGPRTRSPKDVLTREFLQAEYADTDKTIAQLSHETMFPEITIRRYLERFGFEIRPPGRPPGRRARTT